ncbi:hypothetical protein GCM10029964_077720 [Kibdelosporangium lantanae]
MRKGHSHDIDWRTRYGSTICAQSGSSTGLQPTGRTTHAENPASAPNPRGDRTTRRRVPEREAAAMITDTGADSSDRPKWTFTDDDA